MPASQKSSASKPRLVFIAYHIAPNDARYLKLARSFAEAGFSLSAVAPEREGFSHHGSVSSVKPNAQPMPVALPILRKIATSLHARTLADAIARKAAQAQPDLIYVFDPEALPAAVRAKELTGAKLIYDAHEFHEEENPSEPARGQWVKRTELRHAPLLDAFLTVNASIARLYSERRPGFPEPLVVHNAVEKKPRPTDGGRLRRAAGATDAERLLLYQGGFSPLRGLESLVASSAFLPTDWRLVMMGSGKLKSKLESLALGARVSFLPPAPHSELAEWTVGADLGVVLYEDEGLNQHFCSPNKLWEYPAAALPSLASDLPEIRRVVEGFGTGFLVPAGATPQMIAARVASVADAELASASERAWAFSQLETWEREVAPLIERAKALIS